ncbi:MAG TPA: hypothetical protein VHV27_09190 [Phenylobacterium sp.]|jgi:hypothetical protein|nr:hypothetical protein [Phenylobacterium sp.]
MTTHSALRRTAGVLAIVAACALSLGAVAAPAERGDIDWRVDARDAATGQVQLTLVVWRENGESNYGRDVPLADLRGLTPAELEAAQTGQVRFRLVRDAGTFACEGSAAGQHGSGECQFQPSAGFVELLRARGVGEAQPEQLLELAMADTGVPLLDELRRQRYRTPSVDDLARAGAHGVNVVWLQGMDAGGVRLPDVASLVHVHDHGVGPAYIHDLQQVGYHGLDADALTHMHDHGVSADYVRGFVAAGYDHIAVEELVHLHDHGVSGAYLRGLADAGYGRVPVEDLALLHDHDVSPQFVRGLAEAGYRGLPVDQLIRLRDHGVTRGYIERVKAGGALPAPDELIRMRDRGD